MVRMPWVDAQGVSGWTCPGEGWNARGWWQRPQGGGSGGGRVVTAMGMPGVGGRAAGVPLWPSPTTMGWCIMPSGRPVGGWVHHALWAPSCDTSQSGSDGQEGPLPPTSPGHPLRHHTGLHTPLLLAVRHACNNCPCVHPLPPTPTRSPGSAPAPPPPPAPPPRPPPGPPPPPPRWRGWRGGWRGGPASASAGRTRCPPPQWACARAASVGAGAPASQTQPPRTPNTAPVHRSTSLPNTAPFPPAPHWQDAASRSPGRVKEQPRPARTTPVPAPAPAHLPPPHSPHTHPPPGCRPGRVTRQADCPQP